jgi:hypothetical protein
MRTFYKFNPFRSGRRDSSDISLYHTPLLALFLFVIATEWKVEKLFSAFSRLFYDANALLSIMFTLESGREGHTGSKTIFLVRRDNRMIKKKISIAPLHCKMRRPHQEFRYLKL